jgi:hypothetical protein
MSTDVSTFPPAPVATESCGSRIRGASRAPEPSEDEMSDTMNDVDQPVEDEDIDESEEELSEAEPSEAELADATIPPDPATGGDVESIQELLVKQEAAAEDETEEEEEVLVPVPRDDKTPADPTDARVVPMQETEFMCKRCFLVKHRSQLADKKKMLCRDCA